MVRGCGVSRRYIHFCNSDVFSVVNMYLDHLKFCVVCINGQCMSVVLNVILSLTSAMSPTLVLCDLLVATVVKLCTFGDFALGESLVS